MDGLMKSKYLNKISSAVDQGLLAINGNRILIELLEEGEKVTKSGIITDVGKQSKSYAAADRARVAVVLATGPGYTVEETNEQVDTGYKPGDHVLVNQFGVKTFGEFFNIPEYKPDSIGLVTDDLIQGKIGDFEKLDTLLKQ